MLPNGNRAIARSAGRVLSLPAAPPPRPAARKPQRVTAQAVHDSAPAEVHVIAAKESDLDDPSRRARRDAAHSQRPGCRHPLPSTQRPKTFCSFHDTTPIGVLTVVE